jgi:hypothetical protein
MSSNPDIFRPRSAPKTTENNSSVETVDLGIDSIVPKEQISENAGEDLVGGTSSTATNDRGAASAPVRKGSVRKMPTEKAMLVEEITAAIRVELASLEKEANSLLKRKDFDAAQYQEKISNIRSLKRTLANLLNDAYENLVNLWRKYVGKQE